MNDSCHVSPGAEEMTHDPAIHIIVAMTGNRLIGSKGELPWELPEDLRLFKETTRGHTLVMGRRTYVSIGRALPDRANIVITSETFPDDSVESFVSFDEGLQRAVDIGRKIFCIGGREIYRAALPLAKQLHVSWIEGEYAGDTYFPEFDLNDWQEVSRMNHTGFSHVIYNKKGS